MAVNQISRVFEIGREIDRLDTLAFPLNRQHFALNHAIQPLDGTLRTLKKLQKELQKPSPNAEIIKDLLNKIHTLSEQSDVVKALVENLESTVASVSAHLEKTKNALTSLQLQIAEIEPKQLEIELEGRKYVDELVSLVDYYKDQATSVVFQFKPDGSISGSISNWSLNDDLGVRTFTTESVEGKKPTMMNIQYEELGGVFTFETVVYMDAIQSQIRETYSFRIARIEYDNTDGRNFFGGEIIRKKTLADGSLEIRRGVAKLVDRTN